MNEEFEYHIQEVLKESNRNKRKFIIWGSILLVMSLSLVITQGDWYTYVLTFMSLLILSLTLLMNRMIRTYQTLLSIYETNPDAVLAFLGRFVALDVREKKNKIMFHCTKAYHILKEMQGHESEVETFDVSEEDVVELDEPSTEDSEIK
jgi:hypothetical protein